MNSDGTIYGWVVRGDPRISAYTMLSDAFRNNEYLYDMYSWILTYVECNYTPAPLLQTGDFVLSGVQLREISELADEPQFIWATFSSIAPGTKVENPKSMMIDKDYDCYWKRNYTMCCPDSDVEITSFDASEFIFLTRIPEVSERFRLAYPGSEDLQKYAND